ncbi:hypothetical protein WOLCODRAFT_67849 [Wolfiporia cocos MD-104 SS10]|uniref:Rho termination factor N-terminal domain-containing protein n=1 Tax=Wolfiporia cocos (strain MD-104) TaxID=742152 RepID=A0A2H3JSW3_WOLCO|nr:hypothetical protein WOLCODRAFT_67849 [Wolfiporia cocos MD-104 SS10]
MIGSLSTDMSKLTVPQLKTLCKARKITGYSKLGKSALLQKLVDNGGIQPVITITAASPDLYQPSLHTGPVNRTRESICSESASARADFITHSPVVSVSNRRSTVTKRTSDAPTISTKKRKTEPSIIAPTESFVLPPPPISRPSSTFRSLLLPAHQPVIPTALPNKNPSAKLASRPDETLGSATTKPALPKAFDVKNTGRRFKKLIVYKRLVANDPQNLEMANVSSSAHQSVQYPQAMSTLDSFKATDSKLMIQHGLELLPVLPILTLVPISLPPSLSHRKRIQRWVIILSGLSDEERRQCGLVSRMFRYAVYLSASHLLDRYYNGKRLVQDVTHRYSSAMINMWPYLRVRQTEAMQRRAAYESSFVAHFYKTCGIPATIADRLWASPDSERQLSIAIRFVTSRLWFALSVGSGSRDMSSNPWLRRAVVDTQEVIQGEIWSVTTALPSNSARHLQLRETFYVLEATCEVIGRQADGSLPGNGKQHDQSNINTYPARADWSAYIAENMPSSTVTHSCARLNELVKWPNHEEYERGISRLWLNRVSGEGKLGEVKRAVAERYVFACLVANSISGRWMSATSMAQEFAGMPSRTDATASRMKPPSVKLYLPEHHHVESVHFTTSCGRTMHGALASVQTPHREYYILRDNGMQVGCEEEGVALVWQEVLKCDARGLPSVS